MKLSEGVGSRAADPSTLGLSSHFPLTEALPHILTLPSVRAGTLKEKPTIPAIKNVLKIVNEYINVSVTIISPMFTINLFFE